MKNKIKEVLGRTVKIPSLNRDPNAWIFYGWILTFALSAAIIGYTIFFVEVRVAYTIKNVDSILSLREKILYTEINLRTFEKVKERWDKKKQITPPGNIPNSFL